jgi:hypothetical protein
MSQGVYVFPGNPVLINAVYGTDGAGPIAPSDDLWAIVPDRNAFIDTCPSANAVAPATVICGSRVGAECPAALSSLPVSCTSIFNATDTLIATNYVSAALLTGSLTFIAESLPSTAGSIGGFNGAGSISDSPQTGLFHTGDSVFRGQILHIYVANSAQGVPTLYSSVGTVGNSAAVPLVDPGTRVTAIAPYIDNLQVAYVVAPSNTTDPSQYVVQNGYPAAFGGGTSPLRGVRVSVVSRTALAVTDEAMSLKTLSSCQAGSSMDAGTPALVENTVCDMAYMGYHRNVYSRRIELPNMLPTGL